MVARVVNQFKPIRFIQTLMKHNFSLCIKGCLTIIENMHGKHITVMNKTIEIYMFCSHNADFHLCSLITDYLIIG